MSTPASKEQRVIRQNLLRQREMLARSGRLERRVLREGGETLAGTVQDEADLSELDLQTELDLALLEVRDETIRRIDQAIERIDTGMFGICDECGGRITAARLRALPFAEECVDCAADLEAHVDSRRPPRPWPLTPHMFV